jgi:hypothetical protein
MFRVRFQGLMTHAHVDGRWMVVFYNEPGHAVRLAVNDGDWIEDETDLEPVGTGDGFKCFDISGHMQLLNLETGPVTANMAGVPHLAQISDGDEPRQEIRRRLPHGDFVGYLDINGGLLTVATEDSPVEHEFDPVDGGAEHEGWKDHIPPVRSDHDSEYGSNQADTKRVSVL